MARSVRQEEAKKKTTVTVDAGLYAWAMAQAGGGKAFASFSHAVERGLLLLQEHDQGKWVRAEGKGKGK